ncbi:MAG: TetR/AcrR family transcriptional regulator [Lachnospiraceae bacterium]|nr:TetR/AcrR family transcriptional regulator [Lachnospiraceae bacterium]
MVARRDRSKSERSDVIRTRKAIEEAYRSLIYRKIHDRITVTDVINEASISRGTFYAYYRDISDLSDSMGEKLVMHYRELVKNAALDDPVRGPRNIVDIISRELEEHRESIIILFKQNEGQRLFDKVKKRLKDSLVDDFIWITESERDAFLSCALGAIFDSCIDWILSDDPCDREELITTVTGFLTGGTAFFREKN